MELASSSFSSSSVHDSDDGDWTEGYDDDDEDDEVESDDDDDDEFASGFRENSLIVFDKNEPFDW